MARELAHRQTMIFTKQLRHRCTLALAFFCATTTMPATADVVISTTRVIFPAAQGEATISVTNTGDSPALVEAWMDDGDPDSAPDAATSPFLITPPLFRMNPHMDQKLRMSGSPSNLPSNRESLFWLNILEIPVDPNANEATAKSSPQTAIRSRLKFFYRPANLAGESGAAPDMLTWKEIPDGKGYALEAHNPSPYYITLVSVDMDDSGHVWKSATPAMVPPFGSQRVIFANLKTPLAAGLPIHFSNINDYGATVLHEGKLAL